MQHTRASLITSDVLSLSIISPFLIASGGVPFFVAVPVIAETLQAGGFAYSGEIAAVTGTALLFASTVVTLEIFDPIEKSCDRFAKRLFFLAP